MSDSACSSSVDGMPLIDNDCEETAKTVGTMNKINSTNHGRWFMHDQYTFGNSENMCDTASCGIIPVYAKGAARYLRGVRIL